MIIEMLQWWYVTGWLQALKRIQHWTEGVAQAFSLALLARTLFAPWRRITSASGRSLDARMHDSLDNLVSRFVGFFIRFAVLVAGLITIACALLAALLLAFLWPLLPLLALGLLVKGIMG